MFSSVFLLAQLRSLFHSRSQLEKVVSNSNLVDFTTGSVRCAVDESDLSLLSSLLGDVSTLWMGKLLIAEYDPHGTFLVFLERADSSTLLT